VTFTTLVLVSIGCGAAATGCSKRDGAPDDLAAAPTAKTAIGPAANGPIAVNTMPAAPRPGPSRVEGATAGNTLIDRRDVGAIFRFEATHRPAGAVTYERAFSAFRDEGVTITEESQHVAHPFGAKFWMGAHASEQVSLSICEFDGNAAAKAGQVMSTKALASIQNRAVLQHDNATLTVRLNEKTAANEALATRLTDRFRCL
jgi:hypothetical protein